MTLKSNPRFKALVEQVKKNAEGHGWKFDVTFRTVAEDVLLDRIEKTAEHLGIKPETVLTSYLSGLQQLAEDLAEQIHQTTAARDELYRETLSVEIAGQDLGRAVASLGRVAWVMSFNEATLKVKAARLEAININSAAADAISGLGLAIHVAAQDGPVESVTIDGEIVVKAREAIEGTIRKIQLGAWTCGSDDINAAVCAGMAEDLAPLLVNIPKD